MRLDEARRRIEEHRDLNAFISLTDEQGEGTVVAIKDLVDVKGTVTTGGSAILPKVAADHDAPVVETIRRSGGVIVGKANLHEWAFGVTSSNPHYGPVRNPHDPARIPGGSSGGSAVAVATGMCDWALGSDTGGSIRIPAAYCGVVGYKPTVGTVDTTDVIPLSRSLDTLGPLAPDVVTAARALESMSELRGLLPQTPRGLDRFRIAVPAGWADDVHPDVKAAFDLVTRECEGLDFPDPDDLGGAGLKILLGEAADYHRRWLREQPDKYGPDVLKLLKGALEQPRGEYVAALREQSKLRMEAEAAMADVDAILVPTARIPPPRIGEEYQRRDVTVFTRPFNTTGQPVIVLPAPVRGLPVGIQVVGHFGAEAELVEVALALEAAWREVTAAA